MMQETLLTGTARKAALPGWQAAGKTGTSQDWRDAWFIGYTSYLVAGVWLGNDDNSPTKKVSGGNLPVEIWSRFMKAAHEGVPVAGLPLGAWRSAEAPSPTLANASPQPHWPSAWDWRTRRTPAAAGPASATELYPASESRRSPEERPAAPTTTGLCFRPPRSRMVAMARRRTTRGCSASCSERREERPRT